MPAGRRWQHRSGEGDPDATDGRAIQIGVPDKQCMAHFTGNSGVQIGLKGGVATEKDPSCLKGKRGGLFLFDAYTAPSLSLKT